MYEIEEKTFSIIKSLICSILLLLFTVIFFLFVGICKVDAKTLSVNDNTFAFAWGDWTSLPTSWSGLSANASQKKELHVMKLYDPDTDLLEGYNYIVMEFCTGSVTFIKNAYISNTNYNTDFIIDGQGQTYVTTNTCTYDSYIGTIVKKQFQVGRWTDEGDGVAYARAYLNIKSDISYWSFFRLNNIYLSDTDELSSLAENQKSTQDIIDKIEDSAADVIQSQQQVQAAINANNNANTDKITQNQDKNTDKVVDAIEGDGLTNDTPVDKTTEDEYKEAEDVLLNEENLNLMDDIEISLDSKSNDFIWSMVTSIVNSHSLIFGFIITILSLGVLKLVLNR